ncbi:MAG: KH domain-containing protein [Oscillospiraceae bacterium]|nr:KH domain-containing protein [Oscillospiraceae bacterium]
MKELLTYIAQNLVDHPEAVRVTEVDCDGELVLELSVAPEDMGKVIGRQGRIAKEIRAVVRAYAQRKNARVTVDIVD